MSSLKDQVSAKSVQQIAKNVQMRESVHFVIQGIEGQQRGSVRMLPIPLRLDSFWAPLVSTITAILSARTVLDRPLKSALETALSMSILKTMTEIASQTVMMASSLTMSILLVLLVKKIVKNVIPQTLTTALNVPLECTYHMEFVSPLALKGT